MAVVNFWGHQGIIYFYDSEGNDMWEMENELNGNLLTPVNWTGDGQDFILLNADVKRGGMIDGNGIQVVKFPDDGHPTPVSYTHLDVYKRQGPYNYCFLPLGKCKLGIKIILIKSTGVVERGKNVKCKQIYNIKWNKQCRREWSSNRHYVYECYNLRKWRVVYKSQHS